MRPRREASEVALEHPQVVQVVQASMRPWRVASVVCGEIKIDEWGLTASMRPRREASEVARAAKKPN